MRFSMGLVSVLVVFNAATGASLAWQDCGKTVATHGLAVANYSHSPDPIQNGQPYTISRTLRSLLDAPISDLTEEVWVYNRSSPDAPWSEYFHNGPFSRCGSEDYQTECPIRPRATINIIETHPALSTRHFGERRALEHYYADGQFVGCADVVYSYVSSGGLTVLV